MGPKCAKFCIEHASEKILGSKALKNWEGMWEEYYFAQNFVAPPIAKKPRCEYNNDYFQPCEYYINYFNIRSAKDLQTFRFRSKQKELLEKSKCPSHFVVSWFTFVNVGSVVVDH